MTKTVTMRFPTIEPYQPTENDCRIEAIAQCYAGNAEHYGTEEELLAAVSRLADFATNDQLLEGIDLGRKLLDAY